MKRSLCCLIAFTLGVAHSVSAASISCTASAYRVRRLGGPAASLPVTPMLRFAQLSDVHIFDDDTPAAISGTELELALEPTIANGSAQRLQDEYTDEVLNAMIKTVNACNAKKPIELMIATGDNIDHDLLNELRRYIDNLDGRSGADTAYEANCGYVTKDSRGEAKLGAAPCVPEMRPAFAVPTGKLAHDAGARPPTDPADDFALVRSPRQVADATAAAAIGQSLSIAAGLPQALACNAGPGCANVRLDVPYFAVFGNHDGAIRGTLAFQQPFQAGPAAFGRYFFESQREWINEFFYTASKPGPVGHGFGQVERARFDDPDDRNDGYYAFDAGGGAVRMIVLNTLYDGVRNELHRNGQTNADTGGVATGNEAANPIGLETGVLPAEQFEWLRRELDRARDAGRPVIAFSHHPDRSFSERRLGFTADGGKTAKELDELFGSYPNFVAHIAGHTHENVVRACAPGPGGCLIGATPGATEPSVTHAFWRIETASLIDYPQEGRIIEVFALGGGRYGLRLTMLSPDPNDATAKLSHDLSIKEATCNLSAILGGPISSGPYDQGRLERAVDGAGEAAVQQKFCQGDASLAAAAGDPEDRDVVLLP